MTAKELETSRPVAETLRQALQRVVASRAFSRSERLRAFLNYVVETELNGGGAQLKGYTIAIDVFDRPMAFDADGDPLVRVHAGKLRKLLDTYYDTEGADEEWRIFIPKGSYVPEYHRLQAVVAVDDQPALPEAPVLPDVKPDITTTISREPKPHVAVRSTAPRARRPWLPAPISSHFALLSILPLLIVAPLATPAMSVSSSLTGPQAIGSMHFQRAQDLPQVSITGQWPRHSLPARFAETFRSTASHFRSVTTTDTRLRSSRLAFTITVADDEDSDGIRISVTNDATSDSVFTATLESNQLEDEADMLFESVSLATRVLSLEGEIYRYAGAHGLESALMSCMKLTDTYRREQTKITFHDARKCQDELSTDRRDTLRFIVSAGALPATIDR